MPYVPNFSAGDVLTAANMNSIGDAWQTWTVAWSTSTGATPTAATITGYYQQINKTIHGRIKVALTGTVISGGYWRFSLPVTARSTYDQNDPIGTAIMQDLNVVTYTGVTVIDSTTLLAVYYNTIDTVNNYGYGAYLDKAVPFTFANGDLVRISFTYEAA